MLFLCGRSSQQNLCVGLHGGRFPLVYHVLFAMVLVCLSGKATCQEISSHPLPTTAQTTLLPPPTTAQTTLLPTPTTTPPPSCDGLDYASVPNKPTNDFCGTTNDRHICKQIDIPTGVEPNSRFTEECRWEASCGEFPSSHSVFVVFPFLPFECGRLRD